MGFIDGIISAENDFFVKNGVSSGRLLIIYESDGYFSVEPFTEVMVNQMNLLKPIIRRPQQMMFADQLAILGGEIVLEAYTD